MDRIYKCLIDDLLQDFPCVVIVGPRQCGKTTLLSGLGDSWRRFDLERQSDHEVISRDPDLFFRLNPRQVAIDESQILPDLFPALRVAIDANREEAGRFVVTGSSSPDLLKSVSESLAGRVAIVEMAPFTFAETRQSSESPFFDGFLSRPFPIDDLATRLRPQASLEAIHEYWFQLHSVYAYLCPEGAETNQPRAKRNCEAV